MIGTAPLSGTWWTRRTSPSPNRWRPPCPTWRAGTFRTGSTSSSWTWSLHAHKFTFPPPGKTSGEVHDRLIQKNPGVPVVTIGFGPDFAVLRSGE